MIEGFAFQVSNFEKPSSSSADMQKTSTEIGTKSFIDILESSGSLIHSTVEKTTQETSSKENDFLSSKNAVIMRNIDIKHEDREIKQIRVSKDATHSSLDEIAAKKEKTVEELVENLQGIIAVIQNVVALKDMNLNSINLDDIDLVVSVEELEELKVSLQNITDTLDLGGQSEKIFEMLENLENMILSAKTSGEIEASAADFALQLEEMMKVVSENIIEASKGQATNSKEINSSVKEIISSVGTLNEKIAIKEEIDTSTESFDTSQLKEMIEEIVDVLKTLNDKTKQTIENSVFTVSERDIETISNKLKNLLSELEQSSKQDTENVDATVTEEDIEAIKTTDLKPIVREAVEVIEDLNTKVKQGDNFKGESVRNEELSLKIESLMASLGEKSTSEDTSEMTDLIVVLTEVTEVIEILNHRSSKGQDKEAFKEIDLKLENILNKLEKLLTTLSSNDSDTKTIEEQLKAIEYEISDTDIKLKVTTEKAVPEKIVEIEALDEASQAVDSVSQKLMPSIENQVIEKQIKVANTDINIEKTSEVIKPEQFIDIDKNDVIKQITNKVKSDYESQLNEIKVSLSPEHLGELMIKISLERGILSARALVENTNIKQLLESNLNDLKENLREQGLKFNSIDVSVGSDSEFEEKRPEFFMNQEMSKRQNRRLKAQVDRPVSDNYYGELNEKSISQSLNVGEGSMDITV